MLFPWTRNLHVLALNQGVHINRLWKHSAADFSATNYSILNRDGKGLFILQSSQLLQAKETSLLALPTWAFASTLASLDWGLIYIL